MDEDCEGVSCADERAAAQVGAIFGWKAKDPARGLGHGVDC